MGKVYEILISRLAKNGVITTIIGVLFMLTALYMFVSNNYEAIYIGSVASIGLLLLGVKDDFISKIFKK